MRVRLQLVALSAVISLAACGGGGDSGPTSPSSPSTPSNPGGGAPPPTATPTLTNSVTVQNNSFSPNNIQVSPGTTVTWTWAQGSDAHNVTFSDGTNSGDKVGGAVFTRTFNSAGTFNYQCTLHGGMTGSVLVK
jgi:plastocyanin